MNAAAAFVVDPDTHQLYGAYGRGHLSQMDRQKLMTGKKSNLVGGDEMFFSCRGAPGAPLDGGFFLCIRQLNFEVT